MFKLSHAITKGRRMKKERKMKKVKNSQQRWGVQHMEGGESSGDLDNKVSSGLFNDTCPTPSPPPRGLYARKLHSLSWKRSTWQTQAPLSSSRTLRKPLVTLLLSLIENHWNQFYWRLRGAFHNWFIPPNSHYSCSKTAFLLWFYRQ